jgi:hypothetical protein
MTGAVRLMVPSLFFVIDFIRMIFEEYLVVSFNIKYEQLEKK